MRRGSWASLRHTRKVRTLQAHNVDVDEGMGRKAVYSTETDYVVGKASQSEAIRNVRNSARADRLNIRTGNAVDPDDPIALATAEQSYQTMQVGRSTMRAGYRTARRVANVNNATASTLPSEVDESDLLQAEADVRDNSIRINRLGRRARQDAKRSHAPSYNLNTGKIENAPDGMADDYNDWQQAMDDGIDPGDIDSFANQPMRRLRRFSKTPGGRYAYSAGRGAMYAIGQSAAEYLHVQAQEQITGRRDDMAMAGVGGQLVGGVLGASIGGLFGPFSGLIGASVGSQVGSMAVEASLAGQYGRSQRLMGNAGLTALGYSGAELERQSATAGNAWHPEYQNNFGGQVGGSLYNVTQAIPMLGPMVKAWLQQGDPTGSLMPDQAAIEKYRNQLVSLSMQAGDKPTMGELSRTFAPGRTSIDIERTMGSYRRAALGPSTDYNEAEKFLTMGPGDYLQSFAPGEISDSQQQAWLDNYKMLMQGGHRSKQRSTMSTVYQSRANRALLNGGRASDAESALSDLDSTMMTRVGDISDEMRAIANMPGGTTSQQYADLLAEKESVYTGQLQARRYKTEAYNADARAEVGYGYATSGRRMAGVMLTGNSAALRGITSTVVSAMDADISAQAENIRRMREGGYSQAEIRAAENSQVDAETKRMQMPYQIADQALGRYQHERATGMGALETGAYRATQYGSMGDISSAFSAMRSARMGTAAGLIAQRGGVSYEQKLGIDDAINTINRQDIAEQISLRDIGLGRASDTAGLAEGAAGLGLSRAARRGGISSYRAASQALTSSLHDEDSGLAAEQAKGGLTYDQEQRIKRRRIAIESETDATQWDALETGINMRYKNAGNQVRGSGMAMLGAVGQAAREYADAGVEADSPIWGDLNTKRRAAQAAAYSQYDITRYNIPMMGLEHAEKMAQSLPFSPGSGMARAAGRLSMRGGYLQERIGRYRSLMAAGDLSEEEQQQQVAQIYGLEEQQASDLGQFARGGVNRIVGSSAGMPSFRGRYDSMAMTRLFLSRSGNPRMDLGYASGAHRNSAHNWFDQFAGPGFDPGTAMNAYGHGSAMGNALSGHSDANAGLVQALNALTRALSANGGGNPGSGPLIHEQRGRLDAGLQYNRLDNRAGHGVTG